MLALIAADTGQSVERVFEDSLHDPWCSAPEAGDGGFIDAVVGDVREVMPDHGSGSGRPRGGA